MSNCFVCNKEFKIHKGIIVNYFKDSKPLSKEFCSDKCRYKWAKGEFNYVFDA